MIFLGFGRGCGNRVSLAMCRRRDRVASAASVGGWHWRSAPQAREFIGHRILASACEWLAACQSPRREQTAARGTEARDGDSRVVRAARLEAAAPSQQRADPAFVQRKQEEQGASHDIFRSVPVVFLRR